MNGERLSEFTKSCKLFANSALFASKDVEQFFSFLISLFNFFTFGDDKIVKMSKGSKRP